MKMEKSYTHRGTRCFYLNSVKWPLKKIITTTPAGTYPAGALKLPTFKVSPGGHSNLLRVGQVQLRVNGYMAELGVDIYN